jgi:hypothetical protein
VHLALQTLSLLNVFSLSSRICSHDTAFQSSRKYLAQALTGRRQIGKLKCRVAHEQEFKTKKEGKEEESKKTSYV